MLKSKKIWGIILSIFFLWLALQKVDWNKVPAILSRLNYHFIFFMVITYTIEHFLRAIRWKYILANRPLTLKYSYFGIVLGYLINNLLPARAGEFFRAYYLKKKEIAPASEVFGSVVFERFLDGIVVVSLMVFSLYYFPTTELVKKASYSAMIFYGIILAGILLLEFKKRLFVKLTSWMFSFLPQKASSFLERARDNFINGLVIIGKPVLFLKAMFWSFAGWTVSIFTIFLCTKLFSLGIGYSGAILLTSVISVGAMIPSSPGMIGVYQFCCVIALTNILGFPKELSVTYGLISQVIAYVYVLIVGMIVLTIEGIKFSEFSSSNK